MNRFSIVAFVVLLAGLSVLLYPRDRQLRKLAGHPGASDQARHELLTLLGEPDTPRGGSAPVRRVAALLNGAQAHFYSREWDDCLLLLRKIADDPEAMPDDLLRAVRFAVWMNRPADAARFCDTLITFFGVPAGTGPLELMAHVYADNGEKAKAADIWAFIYRAEKDGPGRRLALQAVAALDSSETAIRLHEEHLARDADDADARLRLARLYQLHGLTTSYLDQLEEILLREPWRDDLRQELVWSCSASRKYERLLPQLEVLRQRGRDTAELQELYVQALIETGRADRDIAALRRAAEVAFGDRQRDVCLGLVRKIAGHPQAGEADLFRGAQFGLWLGSLSDAAAVCDALIARFGVPKEAERLKLVAQVYGDHGEKAKSAELWAVAYRLESDEAGRRRDMQAAAALDPGLRALDLYADYLSRNGDDAAARETFARLLQYNGRLRPFVSELEEILRLAPDRSDLRKELVSMCAVVGDYERMIPHIEELRRRGADSKDLNALYLTALDETDRLEAYVAEVQPLVKLRAKDAPLLRALADLYEDRQDLQKAIEIRSRMFELGIDEAESGPRAAAMYEMSGRWDDARRLYRRLRERFPKDREWVGKLAELHDVDYERATVKTAFTGLNYAEAARAGIDLLTHTPGDREVVRTVADSLMELSDFAAARDYYRQLERGTPDDYECAIRIATCSEELEDFPAARAAAAKVLGLIDGQPATPENRLLKARLLILMSRQAEARAILVRLIKESPPPTDAAAIARFAQALLDVGEYRLMDPLLKKWRALDPGSLKMKEIWATCLVRQGRLEEAAAVLRSPRGEKLQEPLLSMYLEVLLDLGRWKEAQETLDGQEPSNRGYDWIRDRIRNEYGPKGKADASYYSASLENILRMDEGYRMFLTERVWAAEFTEFASLRGQVPSLRREEHVDVLLGALRAGYHDGAGTQYFATAGAWTGESSGHAWGGLGADFVRSDWTLSLDLELNRPWDSTTAAAAFDGMEHRFVAGGSLTLDRFFLYGSVRVSRYRIGDGRALISTDESATEGSFFGRIEYQLDSGRSLSPGYFDERLRAGRTLESRLALVAQFGVSRLDGSDGLVGAIPVVTRSLPAQIGITGDWMVAEGTLLGGEFLIGQDEPRDLGPGGLWGGTARLARELGDFARLGADLTYSSEQFAAERGSSWLFQISLSTKF